MRRTNISQVRSFCFSYLHVPKFQFSSSITAPAAACSSDSTSISLSTTLQQYINSDSPSHGLKIHSHILKAGCQINKNITIKLLILHLKSGFMKYARKLLEEMPDPSLSAYNYMLNAYVKHGKVMETFDLVRQMCNSDEKPDSFTHSLVLKAWASIPAPLFLTCDIGRQVHAQILKYDSVVDVVLFATLIDMYVKSERLGYARCVFDSMLVKNAICSTSLISGYLKCGNMEDAELLFQEIVDKDVVVFNAMIEGYSKSVDTAEKSLGIFIEMQRQSYLPTISTFASLIGACSLLTFVETGQQVQSHLMKTRYFTDVKIGSALIDMYSKCGRTDDARQIFNYMPEKNIFSWTSMIDGYGKNGKPYEVIEMFGKLRQETQIKPNYITFLCVISACTYAGFVDKGWEIFESMERNYSLKPRMEHYACMVDLLGRSGNVEQAWEFVMRMPGKPNSDVWAALLSSCKLHGELEKASIAADELFKMCADGRPGSYIALSDSLATAGKWDSANKVRELMKRRGISKDTGLSWTGTKDGLKRFDAGLR
ncbi:pentatricopeptide repeat-containing protein At1g28690, mitochondrial [Spinacia oleracea]|uniref:Pentatricopeptide repeat-containing protein At1g28690, mitochondrial n=1 Tax=Spinacia oleracea TaxID=3562 RepID=A0A9R0JDF5_SPIOL|nr:pentatricopeptide repeat-containing protein At1g28690, mitochondrial-like [Spinacia oleracea]XP_021864440.2 pentatricopeptide repeat-containing protein At1g28690, mitochondrial-like [Spinacia oleracea]XP_056686821.1 pentatricopeptide repeat-containing protein At1g28690, mitochondrial-like [Spinacia oleracea]XP_056686822.1 pentatricopeptide repeat-containing protein At1g28690, mitochondrial-like [Spinacia oleracea]XP_056686823.1 pentatricopeptide repeat-containing protein At1g28690, mitochond